LCSFITDNKLQKPFTHQTFLVKRPYIYIESADIKPRHLYIDAENAHEIMDILESSERYIKKFKYVVYIILNEQPTKDIFGKEAISDATKDVYAIKLFKGSENTRIYCKTYEIDGDFHIIMGAILARKKSQKLTKEIKKIIEKVGSYEYEIR